MNTLIVVAHPRRSSLTAELARRFADALRAKGHVIEYADLVAEKFDPVLREEDEPDWDDPNKRYSAEVQAEMARIERNEATVMIFPVWWWGMPAILKGWFDRVWNHGWAYGTRKIPQRRVWMIGIAGGDADLFRKRGYDQAMAVVLNVGILDYCGVKEPRYEILYGALEGEAQVQSLVSDMQRLASEF